MSARNDQLFSDCTGGVVEGLDRPLGRWIHWVSDDRRSGEWAG